MAPRPLRHADQGARGADVAGDAVHGQQERAVSARDERAAQQQVDEQAVAPPGDRRGQPQAAAHVQRERRPHHAPAHAHADLVGLHLPRLHPERQLVVQQRGVRPGFVQPRAHGPLIQPEGGHDRRDRATVDEQREHQRTDAEALASRAARPGRPRLYVVIEIEVLTTERECKASH